MGHFQNHHFGGKHFASGTFDAAPAVTPGGSPCDGVYYANRSDIELIFGKTNTAKWADVDNDLNLANIDARICWALQNAEAMINDRLFEGPYAVPFVTPYPIQVRTACARAAGVMLYDARGITDFSDSGQPKHQLSYHRDMVDMFIRGVLASTIRLIGQEHATNTPAAFTSD